MFSEFTKNELQILQKNFSDPDNKTLRKISILFLSIILYQNSQNYSQFCELEGILPFMQESICFNNFPIQFNKLNERQQMAVIDKINKMAEEMNEGTKANENGNGVRTSAPLLWYLRDEEMGNED